MVKINNNPSDLKEISSDLKEISNAFRSLSIDMIEQASSGHPGIVLGAADILSVLFTQFLEFNINDPKWPNRDRFVLSAGHGSALLYAILYMAGYKDISISDLKNFRQIHSKTAGHPEYGNLAGIEATTGPLGQGLANAVGMAFSLKKLTNKFDGIFNHSIYTLVGDGCLMEGISQESISFAGHYKLSNLIVLFDSNDISIDGNTDITTSEDTEQRFLACGWDVFKADGHNYTEIFDSITQAKKSDKPALIIFTTTIGFGSPNKKGTSGIHGSPLGKEEWSLTKEQLNITYDAFNIPQNIIDNFQNDIAQRHKHYALWQEKISALPGDQYLSLSKHLRFDLNNYPELEVELDKLQNELLEKKPDLATRAASGLVLETITKEVPNILAGSADLTGSNNTKTSHTTSITAGDFSGSYIHYGVREHAMAAIANGISLHNSYLPYVGTFLVFSDYCRPSIRLSALMHQGVKYIFTHDSIGLGEDGPTHQPVEHLSSLRAIPNVFVFRPCDAYETLASWRQMLFLNNAPSILALSRQKLPFLDHTTKPNIEIEKGAYILSKENDDTRNPDIIIIATGSEVAIAVETKELLMSDYNIRIISAPCLDLFDQQSDEYKASILLDLDDKTILRVGIEAASSLGWERYITHRGLFFGVTSFGLSGNCQDIYNAFGIEKNFIKTKILESLEI